jgi:DNA-directed RNA polymerase subunit M/transcription elongation factor TFIIS
MSTTKLGSQNAATTQLPALIEDYTVHPTIQSPNSTLEKHNQPLSFCPTCKMLLRTTADPQLLRCKKCGYKKALDRVVVFDVKRSKHYGEIAVIDLEKGSLRTHPVVQAICEKCGKTESETWAIPVGSEGTVSSWVFLKCVSCGFIKREVG